MTGRLERTLHPAAWWIWALGLATAASRTTNPILLGLIICAAAFVVTQRRGNAPWALAFRLYVILGTFIVVMRLVYRVIFGGGEGQTVLLTLPEIPLPPWAAGIELFGPVSAEALLGGFYDGLRLATMVICIGAANALANPKRLLKAVPPAMYEVGSAVVVALSVFPQLAESLLRVRKARALRGPAKGVGFVRSIVVPILADALDRSLLLAAAMDSRGYGRQGTLAARARLLTGALMVVGLLGVCVGVYGTLDGSSPRYLGLPTLLGGLAIAFGGFVTAGRRVHRTRYRPDPWRLPELLVVASGIAVGVALFLSDRVAPYDLNPSLYPLSWPTVTLIPVLGVVAAVLPAWIAPPPPVALAVAR